jgi:hypothetical protein
MAEQLISSVFKSEDIWNPKKKSLSQKYEYSSQVVAGNSRGSRGRP